MKKITKNLTTSSKSELLELQALSKRLGEIAGMNISAVTSIIGVKINNLNTGIKPSIEYKLDMVSDRQTDLIRAVNELQYAISTTIDNLDLFEDLFED